jgi:hypothetical protein
LTNINSNITRITWPDLVNNNTFYIASSDANDTDTTGSGGRQVLIQYVAMANGDDDTWESGSVNVSLNGQTPVEISSTLRIIRINRMFLSSVGESQTNEGAITISTVNDHVDGVPQTNIVNAIDAGYSFSAVSIFTTISHQRLYFTRGSYYTTGYSSRFLRNTQLSTFPYDSTTPNVNRTRWYVGDLMSTTGTGYNVSGSAPEFPCTDIEFLVQATSSTINASIYWNTLRIIDPNF